MASEQWATGETLACGHLDTEHEDVGLAAGEPCGDNPADVTVAHCQDCGIHLTAYDIDHGYEHCLACRVQDEDMHHSRMGR